MTHIRGEGRISGIPREQRLFVVNTLADGRVNAFFSFQLIIPNAKFRTSIYFMSVHQLLIVQTNL